MHRRAATTATTAAAAAQLCFLLQQRRLRASQIPVLVPFHLECGRHGTWGVEPIAWPRSPPIESLRRPLHPCLRAIQASYNSNWILRLITEEATVTLFEKYLAAKILARAPARQGISTQRHLNQSLSFRANQSCSLLARKTLARVTECTNTLLQKTHSSF